MGTTDNRGYPYPSSGAAPDTPVDIKLLAEAVDTDMTTLLPVGAVIAYGGASAPTNWLLCDGTGFDAEEYPLLNTVLGAAVTPNLTERFIKGVATRPATKTGGSKKILTTQLPSHSHGVVINMNNASHNHGGTTSSVLNHSHVTDIGSRTVYQAGTNNAALYGASGAGTTDPAGAHGHTIANDNAPHNHGATGQATGGGADYEPQFYTLLYIVKAK